MMMMMMISLHIPITLMYIRHWSHAHTRLTHQYLLSREEPPQCPHL